MTDSEKVAFVEHILSIGRADGKREERARIVAQVRRRADALLNDNLMTSPAARRDELLTAIIDIELGDVTPIRKDATER